MIAFAWKLLRITAKVALVAIAVVALIVGASWTLLQTRRGGELIRRLALPRVNAVLAGKVTLDRFAFGGDRLTLEDLAIYDPEARLVGRIARVDVRFSPLALLRRHVDVEALEIRRPELALVEDGRGLNLIRALSPRHPAPASGGGAAAPTAGGGRVSVDVRALVVSDGEISYRKMDDRRAGGAAQPLHVSDLQVRGKASLADDHVVAHAAVSVRGGRLNLRGAFDAAARRGSATVHASLRGVELDADASVDAAAIAGRARIEARDLAATSRALTRDFGLPPIAMAGNGRLEVVAGGTEAAPSLRATADFPTLTFAGTRAHGLAVKAWVPNATVPEALDVEARASTLSLGGQDLRSPTITARAAGRDVTVHAAIAAPYPLRVDLRGRRQEARAISIETLSIRYPEANWTLRRRARLSFGDTIVLSGLELAADAQRLVAELHLGGARPTVHVAVTRLDLGRLPRALVPPAVGLAGLADADVDVRAATGAPPRIVAKAAVTGGQIRGHRNLSFDLAAELNRGRARGNLRARGLGVAAAAKFDLPGEWPPRNLRAPVALDVDVGDTDLAVVARAIAEVTGDPPARLKGRARVSLHLDGKVGRPRLKAAVEGHGLAIGDHGIGDVALSANGEGDGSIAVQLTSSAPARTRIDITTPLSLRSLLHRPPTGAALARTRFDIKGTIDRMPLAALAHILGQRGRFGGALSVNLGVTGTVSEPEGKIAVDVSGATGEGFPPTDARIEAEFGGTAVDVRARVVRKGRPLLAAEARAGVPVGGLLHPGRLAAAPLRVRAVVGPLALQRLGLSAASDREPPRELKGRLHADVSVDGTFGAPRVLMHAQASDLRLDKALVGFANLEATYAGHKAKVDARLTSHGGGTLHAIAALTADLGYPAVLRGLDVKRLPLDVRLDAQRFDVQGLSGATPQLRTVAGLLTASATMRGTIVDPRFSGRLELTNGTVAVTGFGEYQKIRLALHGDERHVVLDELSAASGSGTARVTGTATYNKGRGYELSTNAKLQRFPIYVQGQPLAVVGVEAKVRGRASPLDTRLEVEIDDAKIDLPEAERRNLQSLDVPADIVLVDGKAPLNKDQAAKLEALLAVGQTKAGADRAPHLRVRVNAPRHLWVSGKDTNLELGLSKDFRVSVGDRTRIFGQVTVHRGRVDVFGRRFDIKADSTLTFGGSPEHPQLDVRAQHKNDRENVTVLITLKGTLDNMSISVTSPNRPDLSESQLYTLIISGHLQFGGGTTNQSAPAQAASILGGVLAGKLQSILSDRLPLDVLTIDVGGEGFRGTRLEAGRYVTDRLYVGYVGRVDSDPTRLQNRNAVHLEYQISARWEIDAEYGDLGTGTADLMWKKTY